MANHVYIISSLIIFASSCTTHQVDKPVLEEPYYTLHQTKTIDHPYPLPNQSSIFVEWSFPDGSKKILEGFRGWDVDHDGRFEMLETLSEEGEIVGWTFDFDGDGKVDLHKQAGIQSENYKASDNYLSESRIKDAEKLIQLGH